MKARAYCMYKIRVGHGKIAVNDSKIYFAKDILSHFAPVHYPDPFGPHTFLHRINTSEIKIRPAFKKIMIFISYSRESEIASFLSGISIF